MGEPQVVEVGQSGEYKIIQLLSGMDFDRQPQISGNNVVWMGSGLATEIFLYDGSRIIQLTNNSIVDSQPQISGNNVVWQGLVNAANNEIFFYDGNTITQLTNNNVHDFDPQISGNNIIWKRGTNNDYELYLYNGSSTIQLTDKDNNQGRNPQIFDNKVVWEHSSDLDNEIYLYDGSNTIPLTNDKIVQRNPQIFGNNVVWEGYDTNSSGYGFGIYLYNGSAPILLSNTRDSTNSRPISSFNAQISGNNVVWQSDTDGRGHSGLYLYDGSTSRQLTNKSVYYISPQISGNEVVWVAPVDNDNDPEIFLYDGSKIIQLSDNNGGDFNPRISGDNVVWESDITNGYGGKVFLATRNFAPTPPPPLPPIPNNSASISIDRWWATIGDAPITVNLTATVPHDGIYILDVVDAPDGFIFDGSKQGRIDAGGKWNFYLSAGSNQIPLSFKVPNKAVVEKVIFSLVSFSSSPIAPLATLFVADRPEPDIAQDKKQLIEKYAPILFFDDGDGTSGGAERYTIPLDVNDYPVGGANWKARLESADKNGKGLLREGDSTAVVNLLDFKDVDFKTVSLRDTPPVIYASVLEHPDQGVDELAINYYFHFARSNWYDHGGSNTHQGDWEGITLFLKKNTNGNWEPDRAAFSQHENVPQDIIGISDQTDGGTTYQWNYLSKDPGSFRPHVYVGLGGHASYPKSDQTTWFADLIFGTESHRGNLANRSEPTVKYLPRVGKGSITEGGNAPEWLLYPGKWGQQNEGRAAFGGLLTKGDDGPAGPVFLEAGFEPGERWLNPWTWADGFNMPLIAQDDEATTSVGQSVTIDVIKNDNYEGNISNFGVYRPPNTGTVKVNDEIGSFTYTPSSTILTPQDDFIYYINTPTGTVQGKVTVKIANNNDQEQPALKWSPDSSTFKKNGSASNLLLTLTSRTTNLLNEIGVFEVDDEQGTINGIAPGTPGYLEAALQRAKVVFSALNNPPNGFTTTPSRTLPLNAGSHFQFYLVQNSTTDAVLSGQTSPSQVLFSSTSSFQVSNSGTSGYALSWEDGSGNQDFADLLVQAQLTDQPQPLGSAIQGNPQSELLDFRNLTGTQLEAEFIVHREAAFNNYVGFYRINDSQGTIIDPLTGIALTPGQEGYTQAAVQNRIAGIDLTVENQGTSVISGVFAGGFLFAPFIIANGQPNQLLDNNLPNDPAVYFPFLGANSDGIDHISLLGDNLFGFEDLPQGGDFDYNDITVEMNLTIV